MTHGVSSRGEGDGLHVMIGDYLWRERGEKRQREEDERDMGGVRCVESDMKACGWIQMWDNY